MQILTNNFKIIDFSAVLKVIGLGFLILLTSCNVNPKPIEYGHDACSYCDMTIVDKTHAAEIVTKKGKVFKFDATECMVNYMNEIDTSEVKLYLSNNYTQPEDLIDATQATFLISQGIPSPMGAYLTAFKSNEEAKLFQTKQGGSLFTWEELLIELNI